MDYFAHVNFSATEPNTQRNFLIAMNGAGIIQLTREEIDEWYDEDVRLNRPSENHLVLHGEEEKDRFENIMATLFKEKTYSVTSTPESKEFADWLKRKAKKKKQ